MSRMSSRARNLPHCTFHHIHSHTGLSDGFSQGNDLADTIAKRARLVGPTPFSGSPILDVSGFYIAFKGNFLLGGVKEDVRKVMREIRRGFLQGLATQGRTLSSFSLAHSKVLKQVRAVF